MAGKEQLTSRVSLWERRVSGPSSQETAPVAFSSPHYQHLGVHQQDASYGRPVQGSTTEYRGKKAGLLVSTEVVKLCDVIAQLSRPLPDGTRGVSFGQLFEVYTTISNKLVGMLMRARRQNLVDFEGEMLFQRRDDHVIIRLLKTPNELEAEIAAQSRELVTHPNVPK